MLPSNMILHKLPSSRNNSILFLILKSAVMSAVNGLKVGISSVNEGDAKAMLLVPFIIDNDAAKELLPPFQIIRRFGFSRYITFT